MVKKIQWVISQNNLYVEFHGEILYVYHFSFSISCSSKRTSSKIQDVLVVFCFALQVEPMLNFLKGYLTAVSVPVFSRLLGCSLPNGAKAAVQMLQFICCGKKPGSPRTWLVCVIFLFPFLGVCDRKIPCHWVQLAVLAVMSNNTTESY